MEESERTICPICQKEIQNGDAIVVCPKCHLMHHKACWEANMGCASGCNQNIDSEDQPEENAASDETCQDGYKQHFCPNCYKEVTRGQEFCPNCGQPLKWEEVSKEPETACSSPENTASAQSVPNSPQPPQEKKSNKGKVIAAIILAACVILAVVFGIRGNQKRAEAARIDYYTDAGNFADFSLTAGANLEDITDTIQRYWGEYIWDNMHGSSIDSAILEAMIDKSSEIETAQSYHSIMESYYEKLNHIPDGIRDEDRYEIERINRAVQNLYRVYFNFYELATNPSGNYRSFSQKNGDLTDEFIAAYKELKNIL